ncbi:expressed unknown protein [Seminavis robusta]|uniref:Secreted protein n=1 Tax=Seminavis robusta TaxID=568900 RepID=A0A9N8HT62_9STRA|nr:expressed unknown protein [Seminavis robusta]|eukprot:Sro1826_g300160.1 n/a (155) ;mRNA; f:19351-19815
MRSLHILLLLLACQAQADYLGNSTRMCAVLNVYKKDPLHCQGKPSSRPMKISCWNETGSVCGSDPNDPQHVSINNVYCTDKGFYETLYRGSSKCDGSTSQKISVFYPKDSCRGGHKFVSCLPGPCQKEDGDDVDALFVENDDWLDHWDGSTELN